MSTQGVLREGSPSKPKPKPKPKPETKTKTGSGDEDKAIGAAAKPASPPMTAASEASPALKVQSILKQGFDYMPNAVLPLEWVEELATLYPHTDLLVEATKMRDWLRGNPKKRARSNARSAVHNWLSKAEGDWKRIQMPPSPERLAIDRNMAADSVANQDAVLRWRARAARTEQEAKQPATKRAETGAPRSLKDLVQPYIDHGRALQQATNEQSDRRQELLLQIPKKPGTLVQLGSETQEGER